MDDSNASPDIRKAVHPSSTDQLAADYSQRGYVVVPGRFSGDEIERWRQECDRLWSRANGPLSADSRVDRRSALNGDSVTERLDPVIDISPLFRSLSEDERIVSVVRVLLHDDVNLFKDKLIFKAPGTLGYRHHQDYAYVESFGFPGSAQLAVAVAVDGSNERNGAIEVIAGRHHERLRSAPDDTHLVDDDAVPDDARRLICCDPGDMLFFHSLCPHCSAPNLSDRSRRTLFFTYNTVTSGDHYARYYQLGKP